MAMRHLLAKDLAAGGTSESTRPRSADLPFRVSAFGGFTGNVTVEHSPDEGTTWIAIGTLADGNDLTISDPVERLRVNGTHTGTPASVVLMYDLQGRRPGA